MRYIPYKYQYYNFSHLHWKLNQAANPKSRILTKIFIFHRHKLIIEKLSERELMNVFTHIYNDHNNPIIEPYVYFTIRRFHKFSYFLILGATSSCTNSQTIADYIEEANITSFQTCYLGICIA